MKFSIHALFALAMLVPSLAGAQEGDRPAAGAMSLVFNYGTLTGTSFVGGHFLAMAPDTNLSVEQMLPAYGVGGRYYLSPELAIRGSLMLQSGSNEFNNNNGDEFLGLGLSGGVHFHFLNAGKVTAYGGGQLGLIRAVWEEPNRDDMKITGIGVYGVLGAEYYVSPNFSFGAEYILGITSTTAKQGENKWEHFGFGVNAFSIHLAFHF